MSYLKFIKDDNGTSISVTNKQHNDLLGSVYYYGRWKRYIFDSAYETIFSDDCLDDISKVLKECNKAKELVVS